MILSQDGIELYDEKMGYRCFYETMLPETMSLAEQARKYRGVVDVIVTGTVWQDFIQFGLSMIDLPRRPTSVAVQLGVRTHIWDASDSPMVWLFYSGNLCEEPFSIRGC
jgi:hypothetical protein